MEIQTFAEVGKMLNYYVYLLVDPFTNKIFYVGKGENDRVFSHVNDVIKKFKNGSLDNPTTKEQIIADILGQGKSPDMYIVRYNLEEREAFLLESTLIELLNSGLFNLPQCASDNVSFELLSNIQGGHSLNKGAIGTVGQVYRNLGSKPINLDSKKRAVIPGVGSINLLVAKLPSYVGIIQNATQRANRTRGDWPLSQTKINRLLKDKLYIAAAENGIITAVYEITGIDERIPTPNGKQRLRFNVNLLSSGNPISQELIGKNVFFNKSQFPIIYCCE